MNDEKGAILAKGITGRAMLDSRRGRISGFLSAVFLFLIANFFAIMFLLEMTIDLECMTGHKDSPELSDWILPVVLFNMGLLCLIGIYGYWPTSWDNLNIIYENGLSDTVSPFLPFSEIDLIGYGKIKGNAKETDFIQCFSQNRKFTKSPTIEDRDFQDDYYKRSLKILKQKCPHVPWVEMEWLEWKKDGFSLDKLISENSLSCPYCGGAFAYIPEYDRWYCYSCREYAPEE